MDAATASLPIYWRCWGRADRETGALHLAGLHSLDVAAVAETILDGHPVLRARLASLLRMPETEVLAALAPVVALHDFGKIDARFQTKAPALASRVHPPWGTLVPGEGPGRV